MNIEVFVGLPYNRWMSLEEANKVKRIEVCTGIRITGKTGGFMQAIEQKNGEINVSIFNSSVDLNI